MVDRHSIFKEDLAAYALDALDAEQAAALEAHLRTCRTCPTELADYQRIGAGLLSALPPRAPRPAVRRNLQQQLAHEKSFMPHGFKWSFDRLALAGAFVLLVGLNLASFLEVRSLQLQQRELDQRNTAEQTAIAMLAYPGTQVITFDQAGISGSLLADKQRNLLALFAWNLPPAPGGKTYQVWLIDPKGDRTSGGFLMPEAGYPFVLAVTRSGVPLTGFTGIGVTLEPLGGSPGPTGPKIFGVDF